MTQTRAHNPNYQSARGLPDPNTDPQFYDGVAMRRLFAWVIDVVPVIGLWFIVGLLTFGLGWLLFPLFAIVDFCYRVMTISNQSSTWGMRAMGIELRDTWGDKFSFGQALVHTTLYYVSALFMVSQIVSIILMAGTARGQALHDLPLGSTAIRTPA